MEMALHLYLETISENCGALLSLPFTPSLLHGMLQSYMETSTFINVYTCN
jgi:hypothetical protein